ncbi:MULTISPECIES: hypothetical protein [Halomonadaceae]|jgi:hypothetical protein|uniref:hypothetical protein n=1 Tax=Halomonadaceae TaxID=28256 RepID=UPI001D18F065|nr:MULTISPECIES: hypothetical protein [Halomonas]MCC4288166.1 hypothetical protein [Halomonas meridiana]MCO7243557.1 hypothetical protein [Halomonas sp. Ps84H-12]MCP1303625.1 hypothetical protein [Halomonas sp. R1t8]MCP1329598.1 hypothetical protein [Halomonas sp. R1t4]|tara:strand:+ start:595 stop:783 length:189 start_codon:yes stop_codon:yes gene_type:complete
MGAAIAQYHAMSEQELRRECIRLARRVARLEKDKAQAEARRDHWFRERETALDEIEQLRQSA